MNNKILIIVVFLFLGNNLLGQKEETVKITSVTGIIEGTILTPRTIGKIPVVLIIAGSGPTDRNGNNPMMTNNSLKMLADLLAENKIASLRYDKRGIGKSKNAMINEEDLRFENYIEDAESWIEFLKKDKRFNQIIVAGHSEGSLIGMIASRNKSTDKFISIAGAGEPAGNVLKKQLESQNEYIKTESKTIIEELEKGNTVKDVPVILNSLFRQSVQPYLISWFKYNPQKEIKKLEDIPVLIIQGTTDIQVTVGDAENLHNSNPDSKLEIIERMNHIMKEAPIDRELNIETYDNADLPLKNELSDIIVSFIKSEINE